MCKEDLAWIIVTFATTILRTPKYIITALMVPLSQLDHARLYTVAK